MIPPDESLIQVLLRKFKEASTEGDLESSCLWPEWVSGWTTWCRQATAHDCSFWSELRAEWPEKLFGRLLVRPLYLDGQLLLVLSRSGDSVNNVAYSNFQSLIAYSDPREFSGYPSFPVRALCLAFCAKIYSSPLLSFRRKNFKCRCIFGQFVGEQGINILLPSHLGNPGSPRDFWECYVVKNITRLDWKGQSQDRM